MALFGKADEIQTYCEAEQWPWADETLVDEVRFVVLDTETTGLDVKRDLIVTFGALVVQDGQILLEDQYEALVKFNYNTSSVVVHGITREAAEEDGVDETVALREFLAYVGNGVIVGHHIGFDIDIISERCQQRFGFGLHNRWLDTMELTLHLDDRGAFPAADAGSRSDFSLDGLCKRFNIPPHDRHTAPGDAFITAQIFLKLLRLARRNDMTTLGDIIQRWVPPEEG